jgi:hypothetical protein
MQAISMTKPTVSQRSSVGTTEIMNMSSAGQPGVGVVLLSLVARARVWFIRPSPKCSIRRHDSAAHLAPVS